MGQDFRLRILGRLLPPDNWGFPGAQIFLDSNFDGIRAFWFSVESPVDCFGMDSFYISEPAPSEVPEPSTLSMVGAGFGVLGYVVALRRRRRSER